MASTLTLTGLDASNPLGFLAALGSLRTATRLWPEKPVHLAWTEQAGAWRPLLQIPEAREPSEICEEIAKLLAGMENDPALTVADDLTISTARFRTYAAAAAAAAPHDRAWADFAAAFGCDRVRKEDKDEILDTAFRTMAGAGHQHFLQTMRSVCAETKPEHLYKTLFAAWRYDDPIAKLSLRWDPRDDQRYALRWGNPSGDATRTRAGAMLGANRLAIEALPLFPTAPDRGTLATTGFTDRKREGTWWTWPVWDGFLSLDVVRSLLAHAALQFHQPDRAKLAPLGIVEIFKSRRVTVGKIRSFTPGQAA